MTTPDPASLLAARTEVALARTCRHEAAVYDPVARVFSCGTCDGRWPEHDWPRRGGSPKEAARD